MNNIELLRSYKQLKDKIVEILHKYGFNPSMDLYIPMQKPDTILVTFFDYDTYTTIYLNITKEKYIVTTEYRDKPLKAKYSKEAKAIQKLIFNDNQ
jgi:hypothetical protein